ncbi:MAG: M23 family metallopeptidase [Clostridia bacterium]
MDGVVASRRLRKESRVNNVSINSEKSKSTLELRMFLSVLLILICFVVKTYFPGVLEKNKVVSIIYKEYKKSYDFSKMESKIVKTISTNLKPLNSHIGIYKEPIKKNKIEEIKKNETPLPATVQVTSANLKNEEISAISFIDENVEKIKNTGITFIKPIDGKITSEFGARESDNPKLNYYHTGTDIAANLGTKIKSVASGTVTNTGIDKYYGKYIDIKNGNIIIKYAHLNKIYVKNNKEIKQGEVIGEVGSTGNSTGPHLHIEMSIDGKFVDPQSLIKELI